MSLLSGLLLLGACDESEETGDDPSVVDSYPIPTGDEILLWTGHGGATGSGGGAGSMDDISTQWEENFGFTVRSKTNLPTDLEKYRVIFMVAHGFNGGAAAYTDTEVTQLTAALEAGTRLVVMAETVTCSEPAVDELLAKLGVTSIFNGDREDTGRILTINAIEASAVLMEEVTELQIRDPCFVSPGDDATGLFADDLTRLIATVERPGNTGDIVLIGDIRFMDDGGLLTASDNAILANNLVDIR
ncbi:MAG: hypothetical protein AAFV53_11920 [Myxococcota bacterium]